MAIECQEKKEPTSWIGRIVRDQPTIVGEIYQHAITVAISKSYLPQKEKLPPGVFFEDVKSKLINEFTDQIKKHEALGKIPKSFDKKFFEFNLKTWVAFADFRQLVDASLEFTDYAGVKKIREISSWKPNPDFLIYLANSLHKSDSTTQKAFFLGNEKGGLFRPGEIETITKEMEKLASQKSN